MKIASTPGSAAGAPASSTEAAQSVALQSIEQLKSKEHQLELAGFKPGAILKKKKIEVPKNGRAPCSVFELQSINPEFAVLAPTGVHAGGPVTRVPLDSLNVDYCPIKMKVASKKIDLETCNPEASVFWAIDYVKAKVIVALNVLYAKYASESIYKGLEVYIQSSARKDGVQGTHAVKTTRAWSEGELVLVPASRVIREREPTETVARGIDLGLLLDAPPTMFTILPGAQYNAQDPKQNFVAPYWCVPSAPAKRSNMKISSTTMKIEVGSDIPGCSGSAQVDIPIMINTAKIKAGDLLHVSEPPKKKVKTS